MALSLLRSTFFLIFHLLFRLKLGAHGSLFIPLSLSPRGHHTLLWLCYLFSVVGREEGWQVRTSQALPAVIGVQEVVEAAGCNWTAAGNLCGWLSKPRSPFHWPSQLLPLVQGCITACPLTQQPQFHSKVCASMRLLHAWAVLMGRGFNDPRSSSVPRQTHWVRG